MLQAFLANWGLRNINRYLECKSFFFYRLPENRVTKVAILLSFVTGFMVTLGTVSIELVIFNNHTFSSVSWSMIALLIVANIILITVEFWLLFHIGFQATARYICDAEKQYPMDSKLKESLVRAVLELSEPTTKTFGLNPYKMRSKHYWLILVFYKAKVIFSNVLAKLLVRRMVGRGGARMYVPYISTLVTGFWDAWVQASVLKEARLRLSARLYVIELLKSLEEEKQSAQYCEVLIRLLAVRLELFGLFNANLDYLLNEIEQRFPNSVKQHEDLYDVDLLSEAYSNLPQQEQDDLSNIAYAVFAFKRGLLSVEEKSALEIFSIDAPKFKHYRTELYKKMVF